MTTHAQELRSLARNIYRDAVALAGSDHTAQEFKDLLIRLGAAVEVFLKEHVYGGHHRRNFVTLIDGLEALGVSAASRGFLHDLRSGYNAAKHDPSYQAEIQPVMRVLENGETALAELTALPLRTMHDRVPRSFRRLVWLAAWDHIIGGDTEVGIFLPALPEIDMPYDFDGIYIDMRNWDDVKIELAKVGTLCLGPTSVPERAYRFWSGEGDFLAAGSFEGDLRSMIAVLARFERVEEILPDAKRENQPRSMLAAGLFAVVDLAAESQLPEDAQLLVEAIVGAAAHYAAPATSRSLKSYAARIAELVTIAPAPVRDLLQGPIWVSGARYAQLASEQVAHLDSPPLMILADGMLVART